MAQVEELHGRWSRDPDYRVFYSPNWPHGWADLGRRLD